jgi:hypothetical protein
VKVTTEGFRMDIMFKKALIYCEKLVVETIVLVIITNLTQRQGKSWISVIGEYERKRNNVDSNLLTTSHCVRATHEYQPNLLIRNYLLKCV